MTFAQTISDSAPSSAPVVRLDLVGLFEHAAWPVRLTIALLVACSMFVWLIAVLKLLQLGRLRLAEGDFERQSRAVDTSEDLFAVATRGSAN